MTRRVVLLSIPGLREADVSVMKRLRRLMAGGELAELVPSFPCVTCPVQANMTTGKLPRDHGVVANGFYWPERHEVEMWTSPNDCILAPQLWEVLAKRRPGTTSAVWFPLHSKQCTAEYVCTPAPVHNPDGSESLWCYTRPEELYGTLRDELGHFPLKNFWGPLANIDSTAWIVDSAVVAARRFQPDFFYIYLPHLDYEAQRYGPDSPQAKDAVEEIDRQIERLFDGIGEAYGDVEDEKNTVWLVAGEYAITPVDHVTYPNRMLREAGLLEVHEIDDGEHLDLANSRAWAMADHQFSHVFVADPDSANGRDTIQRAADLFYSQEGIAQVLMGDQLAKYGLDHSRSGQIVLVSKPNSWQAYYWWLDDRHAPGFARTVDIHRKPGYDPIELYLDRETKSIPLDATLARGSHGVPADDPTRHAVLLATEPGLFPHHIVADTDVFEIVLKSFAT
ncbi:MAG: alkaline phosphatase family protein [Pirellulales bacterium]|nr:alkaline phosphatase family protein [Pirellulales bacterium]